MIHESLLRSWPRLVRWQTQDADAAQLRDELRQAAQGSGTSMTAPMTDCGPVPPSGVRTVARALPRWSDRARGGVRGRHDFARRSSPATASGGCDRGIDRAHRRPRHESDCFWQKSEQETRRAEAAKLLALGQLELEDNHTAALAWATASLELSDTPEARRFAVEALWRGPTMFVLPIESDAADYQDVAFSPDGRWLAAGDTTWEPLVWSESAEQPISLGVDISDASYLGDAQTSRFSESGDVFVAGTPGMFFFWSVPGWKSIRALDVAKGSAIEDRRMGRDWVVQDRLLTAVFKNGSYLIESFALDGGASIVHGRWDPEGSPYWGPDPTGTFMVFVRGTGVFFRPLDSLESPRNDWLVARHASDVVGCEWPPTGEQLVCVDQRGETRFWSVDLKPNHLLRTLRGPEGPIWFDASGSNLIDIPGPSALRMWNLTGPPDAEPIVISVPKESGISSCSFHPSGRWLASAARDRLLVWPLDRPRARVFREHARHIAFVGDGTHLVSASMEGAVRLWPLSAETGEKSRVIWQRRGWIFGLAADQAGKQLLIAHRDDHPDRLPQTFSTFLVTLGEGRSRVETLRSHRATLVGSVVFSLDGRHAAAGTWYARSDETQVIRVWNLETGQERVLQLSDDSVGTGWSQLRERGDQPSVQPYR